MACLAVVMSREELSRNFHGGREYVCVEMSLYREGLVG